MFKGREYPSDLTARQWRLVKPLLPKWGGRGPKPTDRKWVIDAILYVTVTGCQWRQLPHDFLHWKTVYNTFWKWRRDGVIQRVHDALREKARKAVGKKPTPTAAIVDSRSVHTGEEVSNGDTTRVRKSPAARRTWRSIRSAWCCRWWPACQTTTGRASSSPG